jgi:hypothetical protein
LNISYDEILKQYDSGGYDATNAIKPLWAIKPKEDNILEWVDNSHNVLFSATREYVNKQIQNLALYKGIHYWSQDRNTDFRRPGSGRMTRDGKRIIVNDAKRLIDQKVAKVVQFMPTTMPVPASNEFSDRTAAKVAKEVLKHIAATKGKEAIFRDCCRRAFIFGEGVCLTLWNDEVGGYNEKFSKFLAKYRKANDKYPSDSEIVKAGFESDSDIFLGDIDYPLPLPWEITYDPKRCPEEVEWVRWSRHVPFEWLKRKFPKALKSMQDMEEPIKTINVESLEVDTLSNHVLFHTTWHRSNANLKAGMVINSIPGLILDFDESPYPEMHEGEWGNLPIERITDIDIDGHLRGHSTLTVITNLMHTRNKHLTSINRNLSLAGSPKVFIHSQSKIAYDSLSDDRQTIVEWSGQVAPHVMTLTSLPPEVFMFVENLGKEMESLAGIHPISTGSPPPGIKAGVALRLLDELENRNDAPIIKKASAFVQGIDRKTLRICGKFYNEDDNRLIKILGKDKQYIIENFDVTALSRITDVHTEQVSQASRSPASRVQNIIDMLQVAPQLAQSEPTKGQILAALEFANPDELIDPATAAVYAADAENESFSAGKDVDEPRPGEDLITHWNKHLAFYQTRAYKMLPERIRESFYDHLLATEYLMWEQSIKSPAFGQRLMMLPQYPALFHMPPQIGAPLPPPEQKPQQQSQTPNNINPPSSVLTPAEPLGNDQLV